ncbi:MAG: class 1 fructose-bisphosphatase [Pseudomonadota bacterium]
MSHQTLHGYLEREVGDAGLRDLIDRIASACWSISSLVGQSAIEGNLGHAGTTNPQGEQQKPLDLLADDVFARACEGNPCVAALISEEVEDVTHLKTPEVGDLVVAYDPLDGSSNLDVDLSVGSIFAISRIEDLSADCALQEGRHLICSGYALYGPSTMFVLTLGNHVDGFSLAPETDTFMLTYPKMAVPRETQEFAINVSRLRHWDTVIQNYVAECIEGPRGPRGKPFNMRWTASMVAEVHRILVRGGVFLYPVDDENRVQGGKLRLLYEANPIAMIMEAAGGLATDGQRPLLDKVPCHHHERTSVVLGSRDEVERVAQAYLQT